jgi:hypothetical protein
MFQCKKLYWGSVLLLFFILGMLAFTAAGCALDSSEEVFQEEFPFPTKRVELEKGVYLVFERLVATAESITIEYKVEPDRDRKSEIDYLYPHVELSLYSDGARIDFERSLLDLGDNSYAISFDPVSLETLLISVDGYYKKVFAPLELSFSATDEGRTFIVEGFRLTVEVIDLDVELADTLSSSDWVGPFNVFTIISPAVAVIGATVSDSTGIRDVLRCDYYLDWPQKDRRYSALIFSSKDTEWSFIFEPYAQYIEKNITITH